MSSRAPSLERRRVQNLVAPVVAAAGHDLEQVTVRRAGRRSVVRVVVDRDGGVSLDAITELSHALSAVLDDAEATDPAFGAPYTLEVSSPGVDRPLTEPKHWRRAVNRLVRVTANGHRILGRVVEANDDGVVLEEAGSRRQFPFAELGRGSVCVEFDREEGGKRIGEP